MKTSDLIEQRAAIVTRMQAAHAADKADDFTAAETELRAMDARLERQKVMDALDAAAPRRDERLSQELRGYSLNRALAWAAGIAGIDAGREREVDAEIRSRSDRPFEGFAVPTEIFETRVITSTLPAAGPGGTIIPTDYLGGEYINSLTASTILAGLGARPLSGLSGNVTIPGEKAAPSVGWVAENAAITGSDAQFRSVGLTPKHVGSLSEFSRNMLQQSSPDIETLLRQMMARDIALEIDRAAINGATNGPTGLLATSGVQTQTYATSLHATGAEMIGKANIASAGPKRAFLSTPTVETIARKTLDGQKLPVGVAAIFHDQPVAFSNLVPTTLNPGGNKHSLIYGDWSEMLIGLWSALDVLVNPYEGTAYSKGNVLVRTMATVDVAVRHPEAFVTSVIDTATAVGVA